MRQWQLQEAKAKLSDLIKIALKDGPQNITVHGKPAVVLLSMEEYEALSCKKKSIIDLLQGSPLSNVQLDLKRNKSLTREVDL